MLHVLLFLVAVFSLLFLILKANYKKHEKPNLPPGPKGLPIIGNLHQLDPSNIHLYFSKLGKIYGPILSLRFGSKPVVVIQSASLAKEVLKTQDNNFCSRPYLVGQQRLSYNGLDIAFVPYSEYFREIRKICVVHLFSSKKVQSSSPIRREEVSRMIQKISSLSSASSGAVNLSNLLVSLTSSIICRVAFGKSYENEGVERSRFHNLLHEIGAMFTAFFFTDYFPYVGYWVDKLSGLTSRLERIFEKMDEFYDEIISYHLDPNRPKSEHEDIVDVLLQLRKERCFSFDLTFDHIKAVLMNIIVGGTDTSAAMVVWAMTELLKNPIVMRKVQDELRSLFRNKSFIEENDLIKLEYFKAVVKETFRLHPAVPLLVVHETLQKCTVQGYDMLPETLVFVNAWAIGRDPASWKDPEVFMPERFLGSAIDFKGQNFELIPFGAGRRMCPAMLMGATSFELALANLLYSFDWELPIGVNKEDIDYDVLPGLTMHKKNPLSLVPKKWACQT